MTTDVSIHHADWEPMFKIAAIMITLLTISGCTSGYVTRNGTIKVATYNREIDRSVVCVPVVCDAPPKLLSGPPPKYPSAAFLAGLTGTVVLIYDISSDGSTGNFVIQSSISEEFSQAAISAVQQWKFQQATLKGKPVVFRARIAIPFSI